MIIFSGPDKNNGPEGSEHNGAQFREGQPHVHVLRCVHGRCWHRPGCPAQKPLRREVEDQPTLEEGLQRLEL